MITSPDQIRLTEDSELDPRAEELYKLGDTALKVLQTVAERDSSELDVRELGPGDNSGEIHCSMNKGFTIAANPDIPSPLSKAGGRSVRVEALSELNDYGNRYTKRIVVEVSALLGNTNHPSSADNYSITVDSEYGQAPVIADVQYIDNFQVHDEMDDGTAAKALAEAQYCLDQVVEIANDGKGGDRSAANSKVTMLNPSEAHDAKMFGEELLTANPAKAQKIVEQEIVGLTRMRQDDPRVRTLRSMVVAAQAAGVVIASDGLGRYSNMIEGVVTATGQLDAGDTPVFEEAKEYVFNAKSEGFAPSAIAKYMMLQVASLESNTKFSDPCGNLSMAITALCAGACLEDPRVASKVQDMLNELISMRTAAEE